MHKICTRRICWSNGGQSHVTCVGDTQWSLLTKISNDRSMYVAAVANSTACRVNMLTTHIHTYTHRAHFIVPSQTRSVGTITDATDQMSYSIPPNLDPMDRAGIVG